MKSDSPLTMVSRIDYLLECYRSARTEILARIDKRNNLLKIQLFIQVALIALSKGIKLGGVESNTPSDITFRLAIPISIVLVCLYAVEDNLISHLSKYIKGLSEIEKNLSCSENKIPNSDASMELQYDYRKLTFPIRAIAQIIAFWIIPLIFYISTFISLRNWHDIIFLEKFEFFSQLLLSLVPAILLIHSLHIRMRIAPKAKSG